MAALKGLECLKQGLLSMPDGENRRRSERVMLRMQVLVLAEDEERKQIQEQAETQVVNAHGGLLRMKQHLHLGQSFLLSNPGNSLEMSCRVVRTEDKGMKFYQVAFEFDRPAPQFLADRVSSHTLGRLRGKLRPSKWGPTFSWILGFLCCGGM